MVFLLQLEQMAGNLLKLDCGDPPEAEEPPWLLPAGPE
jgi:hypothetical protein